jgi:hypothetical protein
VELNSARGSRSGNFAAQDGANVRARQKFSRSRWRSARALPRGKPAVNLPRWRFRASVGDDLTHGKHSIGGVYSIKTHDKHFFSYNSNKLFLRIFS